MDLILTWQVPQQSVVEPPHGFWISTIRAHASELLSTCSGGNLDMCGSLCHTPSERTCSAPMSATLSMGGFETRRNSGTCCVSLGPGPKGSCAGDLIPFTVSSQPRVMNHSIQQINRGSFTDRTVRRVFLDAAWVCVKAEGRDACYRRLGPSNPLTNACWLPCAS